MKALLKKQVDYLKVISDNTTKDTLLQEAQIALEIKTDKDIREDDKKNREELLDIKEAIKEGLISTTGDGVNSNVIRLSEMVKNLTTEVISANDDTFAKEKALESDRREEQSLKQQEEQNGLLQKLLNAFKEGFKKPGDTKLEGLGTGLAIALGALAGAVQGYVKAIIDMNKFLARGVGKMFESLFKLLPESVKTSLSTALKLVTDSVKSVVDGAVARLSKVFTFLTEAASKQLTKVVQFISDVPFKVMTLVDDLLLKLPPKIGGPIIQFIDDAAKWITSAGKWVLDIPKKIISFFSGFTPLLKTIEEGSGPITKLVTFVKETFGKVVSGFEALGSKLSVFSNMFGAVAKVVQKIAYPLTVIMAVWDTVKGAIEGYEKEGIVGAIKGAITGLFNSLIGGLLDMVKSGISWIAGKLGFTEVEKALDSFSFQDLFKNVIDSIFGFVGSIGDWISKKIESVKNFFGFGKKEKVEAAKDKLGEAKTRLINAEFAYTRGAMGTNDKGGTIDLTKAVHGSFSREAAEEEVQSRGYRLMTDEEKRSYINQKNKDVMDAEKALADAENIPTLSEIWEDFKFGDAIKNMIASAFGTIPDLIKNAGSWIAGKLGFTEVEKLLDSFSFTDLYKQAIDSVFDFMKSIGGWISKKIEGVKNFFGFGDDKKKEDAKDRLLDSKKSLQDASTAAAMGSIGINNQGGVSALVKRNAQGIPDIKGAEQELQSQGYRLMTDEEKAAYVDEKAKKVKDAQKALDDIENIPTLSKIWEDFKFGDAIKNMIASTFGTIPDMLKDAASWIAGKLGFTKVQEYLDSFSFTQTFSDIIDAITNPMDTLERLFGTIGDGINEYVLQPIENMFNDVKTLFEDNVTKPLKKHFEPISKFFSDVQKKMMSMLEDFGIPKVSFTIPIINKEVSIGPFYPFRPKAGTTKLSANAQSTQVSTSASGESSKMDQNTVASGTHYKKDGTLSKDKTEVLTQGESTSASGAKFSSALATFDPETGKATLTRESAERREYDKPISMRAFRKIKQNAEAGGTTAEVDAIVKEDEAYQQLSAVDKLKVNLGGADATELLKASIEKDNSTVDLSISDPEASLIQSASVQAPAPYDSTAVYERSKKNEDAKAEAKPTVTPVIVSAPTTNVSNNKQSITIKQPVRNDDKDLFNYNMSRSAFIS